MAECILAGGGGNSVGSDDCTATSAQVLKGYTAITQDSDDEIIEGTIPRITTSNTASKSTSGTMTTIALNQYLERAMKIVIPDGSQIRSGNTIIVYMDGDNTDNQYIAKVSGSLEDYNLDGDF